MALGLTSLGGGSSSFLRRSSTWFAHELGGMAGGAAMATTLWFAATPLRTLIAGDATRALLIALLAACVLFDLGLTRLPESKRQVPQEWLQRYGPTKSFAAYGAVLGAGLLTPVPSAVVYAVFVLCGFAKLLGTAIVAGAVFGAARAAVVGLAALQPGLSSRVLFRSTLSQNVLPRIGTLVTGSMLWIVTAGLFGISNQGLV